VAPLTIAVLGLGEAGSAIASDLVAAGAAVRGFDPAVGDSEPAQGPLAAGGLHAAQGPLAGVVLAADAAGAAEGSDVVLSVNAASAAVAVAGSASPALRPGQVYADLNSAGAKLKREVADVVAPTGAAFADVALMAPVPGNGLRTPALVSGPGAAGFAQHIGGLGMPVEVLSDEPGQAAARKLLRSVFMKGLAAACIESLRAAQAAGCERWLHDEIAAALAAADEQLLDRLLTGSVRHATRRVGEMRDARELLTELGVEPRVTAAAEEWLATLRDEDAR
jgi:3-hydroxyisobutyrate dehydrogenase-like beta-hydroxyacid dehydrogenase